ncbi:diacylglycerol/lipid kinase family protein [Riemerella columbina]|uniref:diacylglycerol/lipid kinase family protein n=1 Tax=Riemerella columbina TaxID=103810 RepID=UPI0003650773|nr:YegS/Rv2252/BmrU family lipid kinase [Riemerella columbina]
MQAVAFIINPNSAKGNYHSFLSQCQALMPKAIYHISKSLEDTQQFIQDHFETVKIFVAVGGDGTISSVAQALIHTDKILGIYPAGSGNGFAKETHFNKDLHQLINKIKQQQYKSIDTFKVNDHFSINVSGVGFDGLVAKNFEQTSRGFLNYIKVCIKTFFSYQPITIKFLDQDYQSFSGKYLMFNCANTRQFGNNAYIAPQALQDDGKLEMVLVNKFPVWYAPIFVARLFSKTMKADQFVTYLSTANLTFETEGNDWHLDGEHTVIPSPIQIEVLPKSLNILI